MGYLKHPAAEYAEVVAADAQFIDVREPDEVAAGTLDGAVNIPLGDLPEQISELDSNRRVVLLCRSGRRSANAAEMLVAAGFLDVINLEGGIIAVPGHDA